MGLCYIDAMGTKAASKDKRRRTTMVPVTTMEEVPVLSAAERTELLASLEAAEGRIKAGKAVNYDPGTFKDRLIGIYRARKR
jgi:hypothetical protein